MRKYEKELSSKNKGVAEAYASLLKKIREGRKYSSEYTNDLVYFYPFKFNLF